MWEGTNVRKVALGNCRVTTYIEDQSKQEIHVITPGTQDPTHIIVVENLVPVTYSVIVTGRVMGGGVLMFNHKGQELDEWEEELGPLPEKANDQRSCLLVRKRSAGRRIQVRCENVQYKRG